MKFLEQESWKAEKESYMLAKKKWQEDYGNLVKARNDWRLVGLGGIAFGIIACSGLVAVSLQQKAVPFAVELNSNSEVVRVTRADVAARPNTNQIKAALRNWIIGARTVYGDPLAQRLHIDTTYAMTLPNSPAYQTLLAFHEDNNPFERAKSENVEVSVNAVFPTTDETWQIEWTETTRDVSGRMVGTKAMQGSFTVTIIPPITDKQILVNPLGVYVRQFAWTTRL